MADKTEETSEVKEEQPYSREDWIKRREENRTQAFDMLEQATTELGTAEMLTQYLDVQSRFDRYSVSNALLISHQKPDATRIADAKTWQKGGAYIKKGEKAFTILEPGKEFTRQDGTKGVNYDAKKVFDIAQTTAEQPERKARQQDEKKLIRALMKTSPVPICISNELPQDVNAAYVPQQKSILVRQGLPGNEIFKALSQEICYARFDKGGSTKTQNAFAVACVSYLLCKAIVGNLRQFILEFGKDFSFIGDEYRVQVGGHDYYIDLLFYNRTLSCLVAVELKIGEFKPEHIGQINFYLEALDRDVKKENENPSVGLILCASKDDAVVEYALSRSLSPTLVSDYRLSLPDKGILQKKLRELTELALEETDGSM